MSQPHPFNPDLMGDCQDCPLPEQHPVHTRVLPETPYAGTSGWSGSGTSRERAETEDREGTTSARQERVLAGLAMIGARGLTWKELAAAQDPPWHHGQASGALSTLHKTGHIARLAEERRDRCAVYVLPEHVNGRPTAEQGRQAIDPDVVKRTVWRLVVDGEEFVPPTEDEAAVRFMAKGGGQVQSRTVITTPWEDA